MTRAEARVIGAAERWANFHPRIATMDRYERALAEAVAVAALDRERTAKPKAGRKRR